MCVYLFLRQTLDVITDLSTIAGVSFAIYIYMKWKRDYKLEKAHEYAIDMLKRLYNLQNLIEEVRSPKFHGGPEIVKNDLEKIYTPKILEIIDESKRVLYSFMTAKYILFWNKDIIDQYRKYIITEIIGEFNKALYMYFNQIEPKDKTEDTLLFKIVFSEKTQSLNHPTKFSELGSGQEIFNDEFNKVIEKNFKHIYTFLEKETAS